MKLKELETRKAGLLAKVETLQAEAQKDDTDLAALGEQLKTIQADLAKVSAEIETLEQLDKLAALKPGTPAAPQGGKATAQVKDPNAGFADMSEFAVAVMNAYRPGNTQVDGRLHDLMAAPSNYHKETGSAEGVMVPVGLAQTVWDLVYAGGANLLNLFNLEPTQSNVVPIIKDETTAYGATGVQAKWEAEGNQMTATKLSTKLDYVQIHKLYAFVTATDELLADAPRLANRLTNKAAAAIQYKASDALINGDGNGKPLGILNAGSLVTQTKVSGQAAATLVAGNPASMLARLLLDGGEGAFWLANQDVFPQLPLMTVGQQPVWQQNFQDAPGGALFGRPVYFFEGCQTLGTKGDIYLINPSGYAGFLRQGIQFAESMHLYFDYGMQAFRWTFRMGGQPYLSSAVAAAKGSTTKSHFVTLETRS